MATREAEAFTLPAGGDLTGKGGAFGKMSSGQAIACTVLGEQSFFVIEPSPAASAAGAAVNVYPSRGRIVEVTVGAVAVAIDAELTPDANGLAKTAVSTNNVRAKALQAGNAGEVIRALWVDLYVKP